MNEKQGDAATPLGAPETVVDDSDKDFFESGRPHLGGVTDAVRFDETQRAVIEAVSDTMVPPGDGFPAPSEVDIVGFFGRYVTPTGYRSKHFPFLTEDVLKDALGAFGDSFVAAGVEDRTHRLAMLEKENEELFGQLRSLVYYGYYSAPAVTLAIRAQIPAGRDYHGPPLPYGYLDSIEPWDDEALATAGGNASYLPTDEVVRVDLGPVTWLQRRSTANTEQ